MSARYQIELTRAARRALDSLPTKVQKQIDRHILALAKNPYPPGSKKLRGAEGLHRLRVGDHRILYIVEVHRLIIVIVTIGHRREVYR
ncbi:MAG: type II toxin-antitoxin system RelE family toxin [Candidatus Methylomirabilales bacterium]